MVLHTLFKPKNMWTVGRTLVTFTTFHQLRRLTKFNADTNVEADKNLVTRHNGLREKQWQPDSSEKTFHILSFLSEHSRLANLKQNSDIDPRLAARQYELQEIWWHPEGPKKALHTFNAIMVPFIRDGILGYTSIKYFPLKGKTILDVSCGGGILTEALAQLGATVTGIDTNEDLIQMARQHSLLNKSLDHKLPKYLCSTIKDFSKKNEGAFDGVVVSDVIELVKNKEEFVQDCVRALKRRGRIFFTTPNRTRFAEFGVVYLNEYLLQTEPKGTRDVKSFITPRELQFILETNKCVTELTHGIFYNFWSNRWSWASTQSYAYALQAVRTQ